MCGIEGARQRGFTLLEVMVSMTLLSIGVLGSIGLQIASIKVNHTGMNLTAATALAQEQLQQLQAYPFNDPHLASTNTSNKPASLGQPFPQVPGNVVNPLYLADGSDAGPVDALGNVIATASFDDGASCARDAYSSCYQRFYQLWNVNAGVATQVQQMLISVVVRFWDQGTSQFQQVQLVGMKTNLF